MRQQQERDREEVQEGREPSAVAQGGPGSGGRRGVCRDRGALREATSQLEPTCRAGQLLPSLSLGQVSRLTCNRVDRIFMGATFIKYDRTLAHELGNPTNRQVSIYFLESELHVPPPRPETMVDRLFRRQPTSRALQGGKRLCDRPCLDWPRTAARLLLLQSLTVPRSFLLHLLRPFRAALQHYPCSSALILPKLWPSFHPCPLSTPQRRCCCRPCPGGTPSCHSPRAVPRSPPPPPRPPACRRVPCRARRW